MGALHLRRIRELITAVVHARRPGDPNLHLLSGLQLFSAEDADELHDGLHPSSHGYARIADRFVELACRTGPFAERLPACRVDRSLRQPQERFEARKTEPSGRLVRNTTMNDVSASGPESGRC